MNRDKGDILNIEEIADRPLVDDEFIDQLRQKLRDEGFTWESRFNVMRAKHRKEYLVDRCGGKCSICGYNKDFAVLDFHHKDGRTKGFNIAIACKVFSDYSFKTLILEEVEKCQLVCANCYREIHSKQRKKKREVSADQRF